MARPRIVNGWLQVRRARRLLDAPAAQEASMRTWFVIFALALAACGNDSAAPPDAAHPADAAAPDAACPGALASCSQVCVNLTNDHENCGACANACTPAASCAASACACPAAFLDNARPVIASQMLGAQTGYLTGAVAVTGLDALSHVVVVTSTTTAPLHSALPINGQVYVAIAYDAVSATQARSAYLATSGTVTLTRRCSLGIGGTMTNVSLVEVDPTTLAVIPGGCSTSVPQLAFDIASPCS
jgi:hypothetical protein